MANGNVHQRTLGKAVSHAEITIGLGVLGLEDQCRMFDGVEIARAVVTFYTKISSSVRLFAG